LGPTNCQVRYLQLDDLSVSPAGRVLNLFKPGLEMNATTWAKRQFVVNYLFLGSPLSQQVEPYDGLDTMILLSWVVRILSTADLRHEPFVLHYWDLSAANILVTGEDQIR
jgi:hypothetical protein